MFFQGFGKKYSPLADRFVPQSFEEIRGQRHLLGNEGILRRIVRAGKPFNLLFYGPPGTGKTQVARILSRVFSLPLVKVNACTLKQGEWKEILTNMVKGHAGSIMLLLDEIHRLNRLQQEFLLPYLETGQIYMVGITSENPFYTLSRALLSRVLPLEFRKLKEEDIIDILKAVILDEKNGLGGLSLDIEDDVLAQLAKFSDGDARRALNYIEVLTLDKKPPVKVTLSDLESFGFSVRAISKDDFYDLVSAFIKSLRAGEREASVFYLVKLMNAGIDYRYLLRRMIIFAAEDIGLSNPMALMVASVGYDAFEKAGESEGRIIMSMLAQYLSLQKKSNDTLSYLRRVEEILNKGVDEDVPGFLRHGKRRSGKYINPHRDLQRARKQKYISDKLKNMIRGKEV